VKPKYLILMSISGFIVALDQLLKIYVHTQYRLGESTVVIPNFFNITYVRNFGAAFGFLSQSHPSFREIFFLAMPPIAIVIILMIMRSLEEKDRGQVLALSSICGGAIGNYIDRIQYRYVIDFIDFHIYNKYNWPAFNIADVAIVGGVCFLLWQIYLELKKSKTHSKDQPTHS